MKPGAERRPFTLPLGPALVARLAYVAVIVLATITEPAAPAAIDLQGQLERAFTVRPTGTVLIDAVRNVLLFVGWGAVWVLSSAPGPARRMLLRATLTGACLSALVEAAQLFDRARVTSMVDLFSNTLGSLLGAFAAVLLVLLARAGHGRRSYLGMPGLLLASGYGMAAFLESCFPVLRQQRLPGAWGSPSERLGQALAAFGWGSAVPLPLLELVLFAPAGLLGVAALVELGVPRRRAAILTVGAALTLFGVAELVRGATGYPISWVALALHAAGLALGALAALRWLSAFSRRFRGAARARTVLLAYAAIMALWVLRPFALELDLEKLTTTLTAGHLVPLAAYRERMDLFSTADVAIPAFLLLPVGALLSIWPLRRSGLLRGMLPALYLAALLELGQLFIAGRPFDVTDVVVGSAAAGVGWLVLRRAGYRPIGTLLPAPQKTAGAG